MVKYSGYSTMYLRMPMSSFALPVQGSCEVNDKVVTLKFPLTGVEFELPTPPTENRNDFDFIMGGPKGEIIMTIGYIKELKCFTGKAKQGGEEFLTFYFYPDASPMARLPNMLASA